MDQKIAERLKKPEIGIATYMDTPITISHRERPARQSNHLTIGVLLFPRLDQIDMTGPLEVLSRIPNSTIQVIAKTKSPVRDIQGLSLTPGISIAGVPELDVLLVPGGFGQQQLMNDEEVLSLFEITLRRADLCSQFVRELCYVARPGFCAAARPLRTGLPGICCHITGLYPLDRASSLMATWSSLAALPQDRFVSLTAGVRFLGLGRCIAHKETTIERIYREVTGNKMPAEIAISLRRDSMRLTVFCLLASALLPSLAQAQGPVFTITPEESDVKFFVKASVAIDGKFDKWDATLTFPSTDATSGVLDIKIYADSVNTGSGMKDNKLKSKDFFNASEDPYITFDSTKVVQTSPNTFDVQGTFTIRGVSKPETLNLAITGKGTGEGSIKGTMAFDRKDYGMNKGIPFIKIGDRVEVSVALKAHKVSGPPLVYKE